VKEFEAKHGSQLVLLIRFLIHVRNSGVLKWKA
ncbi:cons domain protein, partial [Escherichia coli]|nr:cons domain protein [Escherichia coli]